MIHEFKQKIRIDDQDYGFKISDLENFGSGLRFWVHWSIRYTHQSTTNVVLLLIMEFESLGVFEKMFSR
jgi:hypothetical protein